MSTHVLLIEDDNALRAEMLDSLVRHRSRVTACRTLAEAREALSSSERTFGTPDFIISDIRLPDGDGMRFYIENAARFPDAKWLLMSGDHDLVQRANRVKSGVDLPACAVVDKPMPMRLMNRFIGGQLAPPGRAWMA